MQTRIDKLRKSINADECVLISGKANIFYYSGFRSEDAYLIISQEKQIIVTDSRYTIQAKEQAPNFELCDIMLGWEKIFKKAEKKIIGYEENYLTAGMLEKFKASSDMKFKPMQAVIDKPRRIKDKSEIKRIADAEKIGDEAFSYILKQIKPGKTEREIALELEFFMKRQGAEALSFDTIAASGKRSAMPHGLASGKELCKGDFLTLDFGCIFEGYCSDMTRTVVIGKADEKQKEIYNTVLRAQLAALKTISAGKKCSDIDAAAREVIQQAGYGNNFGHSLGHSVGIEIHEMPVFSPKNADITEEGHVITVEPGIYVEDFGGVRIEDLIVVAENGIENLTSSPKELIEL